MNFDELESLIGYNIVVLICFDIYENSRVDCLFTNSMNIDKYYNCGLGRIFMSSILILMEFKFTWNTQDLNIELFRVNAFQINNDKNECWWRWKIFWTLKLPAGLSFESKTHHSPLFDPSDRKCMFFVFIRVL